MKIVKVPASEVRVGDSLVKRFPDTAWTVEMIEKVSPHQIRIVAGGGTRTVMSWQEIEIDREESYGMDENYGTSDLATLDRVIARGAANGKAV